MASSASLVLYDIATHPQHTPYAPNPCKSRYALNFTKAPYRTEWVEIPDINAVRTALCCPATRKFRDGSDYHTLPMLQDTSPGAELILGDSLDIACYLAPRAAAWGGGALFPVDSTRHGLDYSSPHLQAAMSFVPLSAREAASPDLADYAHFNTHVDATFTTFVGLTTQNMARAFPPASAARTKALFAQRAGVPAWDDLTAFLADAEKRAGLFRAFETGIAGLAKLYAQKEGPFLEGQTPSYADLVVGGWLMIFSQFLEPEEWAEFCTWHGGVFGRLHDVLQKQYWEVR
ncbi:hypothetical protein GGX14DRAFT_473135 [Mycena pura]|uniref:Glutathione S-transferase UstS-like C-terminal domain-containing protein n=1 Tax=Mycena pura TaxID=153505 RepID=A0AAD6Y8S4_9AGAR|nr:hypothetical protein GGX14DRAFT_473135 [Mycena pura]